eukprot:13209075-Alexandrium_andersonii.AAC.1
MAPEKRLGRQNNPPESPHRAPASPREAPGQSPGKHKRKHPGSTTRSGVVECDGGLSLIHI